MKHPISIYLCPDEGLFGLRITRGRVNVSWHDLSYNERDKVIQHLKDVQAVLTGNKFENFPKKSGNYIIRNAIKKKW